MEEKKYSLCTEVLRRMSQEGILDKILLIGSWCMPVYEHFFKTRNVLPPLRTRDVDLLFPAPFKLSHNVDLFELLKDLGFILDFKGRQGYIVFAHPDLTIEFLTPARGRETDRPVPIRQLGVNAQALRFMDLLTRQPIRASFAGIAVTVPHPADFALQKLIICGRRAKGDKVLKDLRQALAILSMLRHHAERDAVACAYAAMPKAWQKTVRKALIDANEADLASFVCSSNA